MAAGPLDDAYNNLQYLVQDNTNVHRVVLAWRAWAMLDLTGKEHAHTLLRQSVRFCVDEEANIRKYGSAEPLRRPAASPARRPTPDVPRHGQATAGRRLDRADGPDDLRLVAREGRLGGRRRPGRRHRDREHRRGDLAGGQSARPARPRPARADSDAKPKGSVHGASVGVHASDSANAWRNIARVANRRNALASMIVGAYHTAGQAGSLNAEPYPLAEHREKVRDVAARRAARRGGVRHQGQRPGPRLRPRRSLRRARPPGPAGVRPAAPLRHQRGRRAPRGEVLPHRLRGVRRHPPGLPLASPRGPGPGHGQRARPPGARGRRRAAPAARLKGAPTIAARPASTPMWRTRRPGEISSRRGNEAGPFVARIRPVMNAGPDPTR